MTEHSQRANETRSSENEDLTLSPSERMAHDAALRVSGGRGHRDTTSRTQRALASIVLGFELIVVFLMGMTVYGLDILEPAELGIWAGLALCGVIAIALATMRIRIGGRDPRPRAMPIGSLGILIGWIAHGIMILAGIVLPMSLIVTLLFGGLWAYCMVKGSSIDRMHRDRIDRAANR